MADATVVAVASHASHSFSKSVKPAITLIKGLGVEGDAHCGAMVKHRSRVTKDPSAPNLRQVHLMMSEFLDHLNDQGFSVAPGQLGENITTRGVDLLALPKSAHLHFLDSGSSHATIIEVTGLRNPCSQLDAFEAGLTRACLETKDGRLIRKAGVMAVVIKGGDVRPGDAIDVRMPADPHQSLEVV